MDGGTVSIDCDAIDGWEACIVDVSIRRVDQLHLWMMTPSMDDHHSMDS